MLVDQSGEIIVGTAGSDDLIGTAAPAVVRATIASGRARRHLFGRLRRRRRGDHAVL
ncbi:MAG: hypothetical protein WDO24_22380 [Pseudomonadota bacterium]